MTTYEINEQVTIPPPAVTWGDDNPAEILAQLVDAGNRARVEMVVEEARGR